MLRRVLSVARESRWLAPLRWLKRGLTRCGQALSRRGRTMCDALRRAAFPELYAVVARHSALLEECESTLEDLAGRQEYTAFALEARLTALQELCDTLRAELLLERQRADRSASCSVPRGPGCAS